MAFDLTGQALGYGDGSLGDVAATAGEVCVNAYAKVTDITSSTITIADATTNAYGGFTAGMEILFQIVDVDNASSSKKFIGCWRVHKIKSVAGSVLTVTNKPTKVISASNFANHVVAAQVITLPNFKNVTVNKNVSFKSTPYANGRGGVVAFKCSGTLKFAGGHIDVNDAGLFSSRSTLNQEAAQLDVVNTAHQYTGWENFATQKHFTLNTGCGSVFLIAKKLTGNSSSRIGNPNVQGVAYCAGDYNVSADNLDPMSSLAPAGTTIRGGATILICAGTISSFNVKMLAKYRSSTVAVQGLGRCYIASETELPCDEALYAYDRISTPTRLQDTFNIKNFGDGSDGVAQNITTQINNYARVTAINDTRNILTYSKKTTAGAAPFKVGALVMVHPMHKDSENVKYSGRFHVSKIIGLTSTKITLQDPIPKLNTLDINYYNWQVVTIPQYSSFTLNKENAATPKYSSGRGGILAFACSGTCDISNGLLNVEGKGGGVAYGKEGLKYISNGGMATTLPLGQGHGSVFILASQIVMNDTTRIGATYRGDHSGGNVSCRDNFIANYGYVGGDPEISYLKYTYSTTAGEPSEDLNHGTAGWGGGAGTNKSKHNGGYGSNASNGACQGAHVLIVADKITGLNQQSISTGGQSAIKQNNNVPAYSNHGGASYGGGGCPSRASYYFKSNMTTYDDETAIAGGGGFVGGGGGSGNASSWGGGGGSGAFCFIYANSSVSQNVTETYLD